MNSYITGITSRYCILNELYFILFIKLLIKKLFQHVELGFLKLKIIKKKLKICFNNLISFEEWNVNH